MQPDLSIAACFRLVIRHYRENPIARMVWKKISPFVMAGAILRGLMVALTALQQGYATTMGTPPGAFSFKWQMFALYGGVCCMSLVILAIWVAVPMVFTNQMYRATWLNDEMLRTSPIPRTDRLMGLIAPLMVGIAVYYLPVIVGTPIVTALSYTQVKNSTGMDMTGGPFALAMTSVSSSFSSAALIASNAMMAATIVLRLLMLDSRTGVAMGRNWTTVLIPYVIQVGVVMVLGMAAALPVTILAMVSAMGVASGGPAISIPTFVWMLSSIWTIGVSIGGLFLCHYIFKLLWVGDIPLARTIIFDSSRPVLIAPSPFDPPSAPQPWQ